MTVWIAIALLLVAAIVGVAAFDADTLGGVGGETIAAALASLAFLVFIGGSLAGSYRGRLVTAVKDFSVWAGLALVLVAGYGFRDELNVVWQRMAGELMPPGRVLSVSPGETGEQAVRIRRRLDGHFAVRSEVEGTTVTMLVDTGASSVMLRSSDARAAGIDVDRLSFTVPIHTANGQTFAASVRLKSLAVGPIRFEDVEALVARPGTLGESLLGMTFLSRLRSYGFSGEFLTLRA